uniref:Uncharacterized protein n=1 Tax=Anguilla anguilla TaxID=7936 RepID=A0A0E9PZI4_ANGAN
MLTMHVTTIPPQLFPDTAQGLRDLHDKVFPVSSYNSDSAGISGSCSLPGPGSHGAYSSDAALYLAGALHAVKKQQQQIHTFHN